MSTPTVPTTTLPIEHLPPTALGLGYARLDRGDPRPIAAQPAPPPPLVIGARPPAGALPARLLGPVQREAAQLDELQRAVGEWGDRTFPRSTRASVIAHLGDEVQELAETGNGYEAADCLLLLLHLAHKSGFSLFRFAAEKFDINQKRTWGEPDERGVVRHVDAALAGEEGQR